MKIEHINIKIKSVLIMLLLSSSMAIAQSIDYHHRWDELPSSQIAVMAGNKSIELSASYTHSLIYGCAISVIDSKVVANRVWINTTDKITPTVFALLGGEFEELSMIGKLGACRFNNTQWVTFGFVIDYKINEMIGLRSSYDNVVGALVGATIHFKKQ